MRFYEIRDTSAKLRYWNIFRKYHYLNHDFNKGAQVIVATANGNLCGFSATLPFPHPKLKNVVREHRCVILPDYQGIGLGSFLADFHAENSKKNGKKIILTTSNIAMIMGMKKNQKWKCTHIGRSNAQGKSAIFNSVARNRRTASFEYIG